MSNEKLEEKKTKRIFIVPAKKTWGNKCTHCDLYACASGCENLFSDGFIPPCHAEDREDGEDIVFKFEERLLRK